jgi:poly(3-hydroxybutyrate) depolymerase
VVPSTSGRLAYTRTTRTAADGFSFIESYLVKGLGHAWPGPAGEGRFTDHAGPDASTIAWDFAKRHSI